MALTTPTTLTRADRVPSRPGRAGVLVAVIAVIAYAVLAAAALAGSGGWFVAAAVVVAAAEVGLAVAAPLLPWALARVGLGLPWRWSVQGLLLVVLVARADLATGSLVWTVAAAVGVGLVAGALAGVAEVVALLRKSPVLSWNLPLGDLDVPDQPGWLLRWRDACLAPAQLVLVVGTGVAVAAESSGGRTASAAGALLLTALVAALGLRAVLVARRAGIRRRVPAAVQEAVTAYAPDVVLYYGGTAEAVYQVEMWLRTLEAGNHRPLVLMRDREAWRRLGRTTLPVVCIPAATTLVSFDLGTVRGALFVANGMTNMHLLRMGGMRTAFIGHGDSDKASSSNPFVRIYDEVWVAGPAGARRYADAGLGAVLGRIREVGRPQADAGARPSAGDRPLTVVYAPTWEGWGDESHHSSLVHDGTALVSTLLATPGVRVVYRPHPLTGTRDAAVRRAHRDVISLLRAAGAPREVPQAAHPSTGDEVSLMVAAARSAPVAAAGDDAPTPFWGAYSPATHRIAEGDWPGLESVLAEADVLVADVSGVVSDWLAQDRPLALANPAGLSAEEFGTRYPSSRGGLVLGSGGAGLGEFLAALRAGQDPTAVRRSVARSELLGSTPDGGAERFAAALDALVGETPGPGAAGWAGA
jgi:hypothetical protein